MDVKALRIGEVAAQAEVNLQTIRYYERRGLLSIPARSAAGQRMYPAETVRVIRFIRRAQGLGFTLQEIGQLVALRGRRVGNRINIQRLASGKLQDVELKLARLGALRDALATLVQSCSCATGELECPILEALEDAQPSPVNRTGTSARRLRPKPKLFPTKGGTQ